MFIHILKRGVVPLVCALGLSLGGQAVAAYPDKPVTVIVPQGAGGANDVIARIVVQKLGEVMKQPFVIENRPGAGGNLGTVAVARAKPDGYTLMLTVNGAHAINPALYRSAGFDPIKDFEPVAPVATVGYILVANPSFPANNVKELIALAKAKPGSVQYASAGNGTINHLLVEILKSSAGIDMMHVPYKTASASVTDVVGGQVPLSMQSLPSSLSFVKAGKLKVLGVANEKRLPLLPDVPTIGESLPGYGSTPWYGVLMPAGTPVEIVKQLHAALDVALSSNEVQTKLSEQGAEVFKLSSAQFSALIKQEVSQWAKVVKASGAMVD